jgi:putative transposase
MRTKKTELYVHLIWSTWGGEPILADLDEARLYEVIQEIAAQMSVDALAVGGTDDHIHVLARIPSTIPVDHIAGGLKAAAAQHIAQSLTPGARFRWAAAYAAFTVSPGDAEKLTDYIQSQSARHASGSVDASMELSPT